MRIVTRSSCVELLIRAHCLKSKVSNKKHVETDSPRITRKNVVIIWNHLPPPCLAWIFTAFKHCNIIELLIHDFFEIFACPCVLTRRNSVNFEQRKVWNELSFSTIWSFFISIPTYFMLFELKLLYFGVLYAERTIIPSTFIRFDQSRNRFELRIMGNKGFCFVWQRRIFFQPILLLTPFFFQNIFIN